jgi:hypothetical protein
MPSAGRPDPNRAHKNSWLLIQISAPSPSSWLRFLHIDLLVLAQTIFPTGGAL